MNKDCIIYFLAGLAVGVALILAAQSLHRDTGLTPADQIKKVK